MINRLFGATTLVFLIAFLAQMAEILRKHACWCDFRTPPGVSEIVVALLAGLGAVAAALKTNVGGLFTPKDTP